MSRRVGVPKREILPDPIYNSQLVTKFINVVMKDGKKSTAERIFYDALELIGERTEDTDPKSRRVGGSTYQVPIEVRPGRRLALSMRWLIASAKKRGEKTMHQRLAGEFMDAAANRGAAIKKKEDTHRMAEANKAFSHYRW